LRKIIKLVGKLVDRQVRSTCGVGINIDSSIQLYRKKKRKREIDTEIKGGTCIEDRGEDRSRKDTMIGKHADRMSRTSSYR
jgi:hypothetical protein